MASSARTFSKDNAKEIARWCGGKLVEERDALDESIVFPGINVPTKDGIVRASPADIIIQHSDGTFGVFKY